MTLVPATESGHRCNPPCLIMYEAAYENLRAAAKRFRDAEWALRIEQDAPYDDIIVTSDEHNAAVERWRAADAELASLIGERSPFTKEGT